ncbi:MAG: molybdopterin-guanine dinucleotide biosynthesis protein B [Lachnospiraceae bacterium]|nr:molybdopterin-guanine dinucleotide biosynthesis protein B [Lachnospiraceae bacterium]
MDKTLEKNENKTARKFLSIEKLRWRQDGPPLLAVCGKKNSGKTTYLEQVVHKLAQMGVKAAVIKHDGHEFLGDVPGTDSFRMYQAGAEGTAVFSERQVLIHKRIHTTLQEVTESFLDADLILAEGLKELPVPKLEIIREGIGQEPCSNPKGRIGIITDRKDYFKCCGDDSTNQGTPGEMILDLNCPEELARMLRECLKGRQAAHGKTAV